MPLSIQAPTSKAEAQQFLVGMMMPTMDGAKAAEVISSWFQLKKKPGLKIEACKLVDPCLKWDGTVDDLQNLCLRRLNWWLRRVHHNPDSGALVEEDLCVYYAINQIATLMPAHYNFSQTISNIVADLLCDTNNFAHHINAAGVDLASCPTVVNLVPFGLEMPPLEAKDNDMACHLFTCSIIPDGLTSYFMGWAIQYFHELRKLKQGYPDYMKGRAFKGHNLDSSSRNMPDLSHAPILADSPELLDEEMLDMCH
ncbi:uncharacterized protein LAESUDRAFT_715599 [Laetiporus sulphureus 93-53]|uniref:Uncharacterized protein n=1 Tax=Laetiporus sulphureus 93-53 TaxID=1314785 RepID=A0A165D6P1_9APHY|nr:uncharacterized protein LAESUDRAFT_715599 [Laetiporus sulphureus 93-53]KZT04253.1 hypothetical protein LAESUDRAFT_715599 [Laetiporus sulphureus 93-53]